MNSTVVFLLDVMGKMCSISDVTETVESGIKKKRVSIEIQDREYGFWIFYSLIFI